MRMSDVLAEVPVDEEIKKPLVGEPSRYRPIFEVVLDYESATCDQLAHSARRVGLREEFLPDLYLQSVRWVTEVLAEAPAGAGRRVKNRENSVKAVPDSYYGVLWRSISANTCSAA
jgi:hypothetical protein